MVGAELKHQLNEKIWLLMILLIVGNILLFTLGCMRDPVDSYEYRNRKKEILESCSQQDELYQYVEPTEESGAYRAIRDELENINTYKEYVKRVVSGAEKLVDLSAFDSEYDQTVLRETIDDYGVLSNNQMHFVGAYGIGRFFSYRGWIFFYGLFALSAAYTSLIREKENGVRELTKTTRYGGYRLGLSKALSTIVVGLITISVSEALVCAESLLQYGGADMSLPVQVLPMFRGVGMNITIRQAVLLCITIRTIIGLIMIVISMLFGTISGNSLVYCFGHLVVIGINLVVYNTQEAGLGAYLKNASFLNSLYMEKLFDYDYINVACFPVKRISFFIVVQILFLILILAAFIISFEKCRTGYSFIRLYTACNVGKKTSGIFKNETVKWLVHYRGWLIFFSLFSTLIIYYASKDTEYSLDGLYYKHYMSVLEGDFTEEKVLYLSQEREKYNAKRQLQDELYVELNNAELPESYKKIYEEIRMLDSELEGDRGLALCEDKAVYLSSLMEENTGFVYERGWYELFGIDKNKNDMIDGLFCVIPIILGISMLWSQDAKYRMSLIESGLLMNGKKQKAKIILSMVLVLLVFIIVTFCRLLWSDLSYGLNSGSYTVTSLMRFSDMCYNMSIANYYVIVLLIRLSSLLLTAGIVMAIALITKNTYISVFLSFVILIMPFILNLLDLHFLDSESIVALFSGNMLLQ